jgi:hypothetical protein
MPILEGKTWFRDNVEPYMTIVKGKLDTLSSVTGQHITGAATFATLPGMDNEGGAVGDGDITTLTVDDIGTGSATTPQYPAGLYIRAGTVWGLLFAIPDIADILLNIVATPAEVDTGTDTSKVASVAQLTLKYAKVGGLNTQLFEASAGNIGTDEVLNANQFVTFVTPVEAQADWDAIV